MSLASISIVSEQKLFHRIGVKNVRLSGMNASRSLTDLGGLTSGSIADIGDRGRLLQPRV